MHGGQHYMDFVANFILPLTVKKFWRSFKFWPCYRELNRSRFLGHSVHMYVFYVFSCVYVNVLFGVISDKYNEPCELSPELAAIMGEPRVSVFCWDFVNTKHHQASQICLTFVGYCCYCHQDLLTQCLLEWHGCCHH